MFVALRMFIAGGLVAAGLAFVIGGIVGIFRFPDVYTRGHALGAGVFIGPPMFFVGLAVAAWDAAIVIRLALLGVLLQATAPIALQMVLNAAHAAGLAPVSGVYTAPRPSATKARSAGP